MLTDLTGNGKSYGKFLGSLSMCKAYFHHCNVELYSYIVMILQQVHLKAFADRMSRFNDKVISRKKYFKKHVLMPFCIFYTTITRKIFLLLFCNRLLISYIL